jgi:hypothetical protein
MQLDLSHRNTIGIKDTVTITVPDVVILDCQKKHMRLIEANYGHSDCDLASYCFKDFLKYVESLAIAECGGYRASVEQGAVIYGDTTKSVMGADKSLKYTFILDDGQTFSVKLNPSELYEKYKEMERKTEERLLSGKQQAVRELQKL